MHALLLFPHQVYSSGNEGLINESQNLKVSVISDRSEHKLIPIFSNFDLEPSSYLHINSTSPPPHPSETTNITLTYRTASWLQKRSVWGSTSSRGSSS